MPRQSPGGKMNARVGNYRADVDTTDMDPSMKEMFAEGNKPNPGAEDFGSRIKSFFGGLMGKKPQGRPAAKQAQPAATPHYSSAQVDSMLNSWPGKK